MPFNPTPIIKARGHSEIVGAIKVDISKTVVIPFVSHISGIVPTYSSNHPHTYFPDAPPAKSKNSINVV